MRLTLFLFATLFLFGCHSLQQQNEAARERETRRNAIVVTDNPERVSNCQMLTEVTVAPPFPLLNQAFSGLPSVGNEEVKKNLRRETLREGGDTVLRTGVDDGKVRGKAYDCRGARS